MDLAAKTAPDPSDIFAMLAAVANPVKSDVALNFPSDWFNDQNAGTPKVLRDYKGLKPTRMLTANVTFLRVEAINWGRVEVGKFVAVPGDGAKSRIDFGQGSDWAFYFEDTKLMVVSENCKYPIGLRGYFDVTALYE